MKRELKGGSGEKKIGIEGSVRKLLRGMCGCVKEGMKVWEYEGRVKKGCCGKWKGVGEVGEEGKEEMEGLVRGKEMRIEEFISERGVSRDELVGVGGMEKGEVK